MESQSPVSSDVRLRAVLDAAPSGMLMSDADGRIVLANAEAESLFGHARGELVGRMIDELAPERLRAEQREKRAALLAEPARAGEARGETRGVRRDGSEIPVEIALRIVAAHGATFVLSSITDIRNRKHADERFEIAVESSPNGMLMIDGDGRIVLVNREIERMFGYSRTELLGQPIELLVPERFRGAHIGDRTKFLKEPQTRSMGAGRDLHGVRKDGTEIPLEIGLNPIQTDEGMFVLGSVLDISARKRAEDERLRLEEQLRHAQKMEAVGRLASGIAHDFNNVLMGIMSCGALVKHTLAPDHPASSIIDDMCNAAERGATLSRDLLNFSRRRPADAVSSQLNDVVRVAERMLRQMIGEDIALVVELCPSGGPIIGNPTHLEHILLNLAVNARDAMPKGGRLRIATRDVELAQPLQTRGRVLEPGAYIALTVEDSGTGMLPATRERLFEPFFTTKDIGTGTGLGLYTVYSITQQLGGGIDVESEIGVGSRFTLHFPLREGLRPVMPLASPTKLTSTNGAGARILIVEDERLIRMALGRMLSQMGYDVLEAANAAKALHVASANKIDLVLSDMVLPDANGAELVRTLRAGQPALKVLFMSAYPNDLLVQQGRIPAGTTSLQKPFDEETLAHAVRNALAESRATADQAAADRA
jgi:PAS domain S-box-containing protein